MSTTNGQLYIVDVATRERLEIQFVPDNVSWPRQVNETEIIIIGRNNPLLHYTTGTDKLKFDLKFFSESDNREDVIEKVRWLRSLTYGENLSDRPRVRLVWGRLFRDEVWQLSEVNPDLTLFDSTEGFLPVQATVSVTFTLTPDKNVLRYEVR